MSIRKPPARSTPAGRPAADHSEPDYDAVDLVPEAAYDAQEWEEDAPASPPEAAQPERAGGTRTPNGQANGHATSRAARASTAVEDEAPAVVDGTPVALTDQMVASEALPQSPVADLSLQEWLGRRWLLGLTAWQTLLVVGLLVALILTRFHDLGVRAMHHDESMHAKFAWDTFHGQIYKYNPLLHGPFQFLAVATSFWLLGATEWTARAVPATFGVALVVLTFCWRRWLGNAGWIFAVAIFIFSPSFTYFARMLREDSYTATWTMLAATGLVGYVLHRQRPWYYAFCAGLAFAFCTKESTYITAFIFGTFMILSLLWERANVLQRRLLIGASAGGIVGAFYSMVIDASLLGLHKKELKEVGGAIICAAAGAVAAYVYHLLTPVPEDVAATAPATLTRAQLRARRLRQSVLDRPTGRFTLALQTVWQDHPGFWGVGTFWGGVIIFFSIFVLFYSSFFTNVAGIREGLVGSIRYWLEQHGVQRGNQPWFYYLLILGAYETLPWVFALAGTVHYLRRPTWLTTFLIWWWVLALVIYSWAGEKMPWLIIHIALPMVLLSARYLGELATSALRNAWEKRIAFGGLAVLSLWTIHTGWPVNFERPDTPKDFLVYTQTAPDVKKVMQDIERLSLEQTGDARGIGITVQSGTWWPFSWYLRDFKNADYPAQLTAQATKPIVLVALEDDDKNRPFLQGYTRTRYRMRWWYPEDYRSIPDQIKQNGLFGYLGRKDVQDGLWKWLVYRETTQPLGSYDFYVYLKDGLAPGAAPAATAQPGPAGAPLAGQAPDAAVVRPNPEQYAAKMVPLALTAQWGTNGKAAGQFNTPRSVALDSQGNVYVADTLNHRIQKFDGAGKPLAAWGSEGNGNGQFKEPMGVAVDGQGNVFVADTWNHRIQKFDANGKYLTQWPGQGGFWGPRGIALDAQGNVYVTDTGNKRVQKFDANGKFLAQFGTGGSGPGQLNEPIGLAVSPAGDVYVADTNNRRIQKFDASGQQVAEWPVAGWQGGARNEPYLALDAQDNVYVTDPANARIVKFSPTGDVLAAGGTLGKTAGQFDVPLGIAAGNGAIYVTDSGNNRLEVFAPLP